VAIPLLPSLNSSSLVPIGTMHRILLQTLASSKPVMTVGSFWPYATTLYDYINRAMPLIDRSR
jgi:hypothetical protein